MVLVWKKITSRDNIGKLLLKLPNGIFPSYRCVVNIMPSDDDTPFLSSEEDSVKNSSIKSRKTPVTMRCKYCYKKKMLEEANFREDTSPLIPPAPPFPHHLVNFEVDKDHQINDIADMIRQKITADDLKNVKLRKPQTRLAYFSTPVRDLCVILKKRYDAMHTPTPTPKISANDELDDDDIDDFDDGVLTFE